MRRHLSPGAPTAKHAGPKSGREAAQPGAVTSRPAMPRARVRATRGPGRPEAPLRHLSRPPGSPAHTLKTTFESLQLSPELLKVTQELGYACPTEIQALAIPPLIAGRDLIGKSKTGSGKTAAFALPLLQRVRLDQRRLQALILCPTRELAAQVRREIRTLGRGLSGLVVLELVGGQPARAQREALSRGAHLAVGTPGRVMDLLGSEALDPHTIRTLVLDEADRMLDMGFGPEVGRVVQRMPAQRQTVLFSATLPEEIETMSGAYQREAVRVEAASPEAAVPDIEQWKVYTPPDERFDALIHVLHRLPHASAIIFCNYKASVQQVTQRLKAAGVSADRLDGSLDQFHRDQVLSRFRAGSVKLLVATDVAGRGIDVAGLDLVVNYELPQQPEIYVHRIGRTGRAEASGVAVSLAVGPADARVAGVEDLTGTPIRELPVERAPEPIRGLLKQLAGPAAMASILISGGRKDKVRPGDIVGALTGEAGGLQGSAIGKIEVLDRFSYVAVEHPLARLAVERLNRGRIKGKRFRATLTPSDA